MALRGTFSENVAYPIAYAARLAGIDASTARRWVAGKPYVYKGKTRRAKPVLNMHDTDAPSSGVIVTFEELLTLKLVAAFRAKGLGLPTIRRAAQIAADKYGLTNPFITQAFRSDGKSVFLLLKEKKQVRGKEGVLVEALTGQQQFNNVVEPSLFKDVVFFGDTASPQEWFPQGKDHSVVIRPDRVFGAPHVKDTGVRTDVIAEAVSAEGDDAEAITSVAEWFRLSTDQVRDAVAAEAGWNNQKAA